MRCSSLAALRCENHTHSVPQAARQRRPETRLSVCHLRETPEPSPPPPPQSTAPSAPSVRSSPLCFPSLLFCSLLFVSSSSPAAALLAEITAEISCGGWGEENKCTRRGIWRNIWGLPACRDAIGCDFERAQERGGSPGRLRFRSAVQPGRSWQTWLSFFLFFPRRASFISFFPAVWSDFTHLMHENFGS